MGEDSAWVLCMVYEIPSEKVQAILPRRRTANVDVHEAFYNNPNKSINKVLRKGCSAKTSIPFFKSH